MDLERLKQLVAAMQEDLDKAFPEFYELTKRNIYLNLFSFTKSSEISEDLLQDTYIRFIEGLGKMKESSSPLGLLYTISRNLALDEIRKRQREVSLDTSFSDPENYFAAEVEKVGEGEYFYFIRRILNDQEYKIITLHLVDDLPHREIAEVLKIPIGTVTWSYQNALKKIRKEEAKYEKRRSNC